MSHLKAINRKAQRVLEHVEEEKKDVVALQRGRCLFGDRVGLGWTTRISPHDRCSKPINLETLDEGLAYVVGLIVGDGCLTQRNRIVLSSADPEVVSRFRELAARLGLHVFPNGSRPYDHVIASSGLYQLLERMGLSVGKENKGNNSRAATKVP